MEAKDTAMGDEEMGRVKFDMGSPWGVGDKYTVGRAIAEAQAEISFKAGIREVVEWLLQDDDMPLGDDFRYPPRTVAQIKAKLKEWGIK